jgi:ribose transport system substrate-binding protein
MRLTKRFAGAAALAWMAALGAGCGGETRAGGGAAARAGQLTIAVIPKGTSHEYWKSIHAGAVKAARELSAAGTPVQIVWKGPLREDDRDQQVQVVEGFLSGGANGMVLAPLDEQALVRPVEEAKAAGVPVVIVDSPLKTEAIVSYVATDNFKGGQLAADGLAELSS